MAVTLAIAFEIGAAACLAAIITLDKMNKTLIWTLFIAITLMQINGNLYNAYINIEEYQYWSELFNLTEWEQIDQKRLLAVVSGGILPLVALGFIKALVDYIRPNEEPNTIPHVEVFSTEGINIPEKKTELVISPEEVESIKVEENNNVGLLNVVAMAESRKINKGPLYDYRTNMGAISEEN